MLVGIAKLAYLVGPPLGLPLILPSFPKVGIAGNHSEQFRNPTFKLGMCKHHSYKCLRERL